MTPHAHRRYLPPAEPPRQRISRGDLVGLVGVLLVIVGFVLWIGVTW
jgi:hypothetical protein